MWNKWNFWEGYAPEMTLYKVIRDIHLRQDHFGVYPDAKQFLTSLREKGFYIVIASHREKGTIHAAKRWLKKHELPFDEVHLSYDKSVLFSDAWAIVDDSPVTLDKALKVGIVRAGLRNPWNEHTKTIPSLTTSWRYTLIYRGSAPRKNRKTFPFHCLLRPIPVS